MCIYLVFECLSNGFKHFLALNQRKDRDRCQNKSTLHNARAHTHTHTHTHTHAHTHTLTASAIAHWNTWQWYTPLLLCRTLIAKQSQSSEDTWPRAQNSTWRIKKATMIWLDWGSFKTMLPPLWCGTQRMMGIDWPACDLSTDIFLLASVSLTGASTVEDPR